MDNSLRVSILSQREKNLLLFAENSEMRNSFEMQLFLDNLISG